MLSCLWQSPSIYIEAAAELAQKSWQCHPSILGRLMLMGWVDSESNLFKDLVVVVGKNAFFEANPNKFGIYGGV